MKRSAIFLCIILCVLSLLGCVATPTNTNLVVVCPDGAPAISAYALEKEEGLSITVYPSVSATTSIKNDLVKRRADVAILPVNLASKLCASGADYKMVGVLTHGNLYGISKTVLDENGLKGKTVGVIQLNAVPGYTVKLMLEKMGLQYVENASEKTEDNVYLHQIQADAIAVKNTLDKGDTDVCIVAEPMCSKLISSFGYERCVDVQHEYGSFPQAVMLIKSSVLENNKSKVNKIISKLKSYNVVAVDPTALVAWINTKMVEGTQSSLMPSALTAQALKMSNIRFSSAEEQKARVNEYISSLKRFDTDLGSVAESLSDTFFWSGV